MRTIGLTIPHEDQKYPTVGDYITKDGVDIITISETGNDDYNFLIYIHELIELHLTRKRGIIEEDITKFDIMFEKEREEGKHTDEEPGFDPRSPYIKEHTFATEIEKLVAEELEVDWENYEETLNNI